MVIRRFSDPLEVSGAQALLAACRALHVFFDTEKIRLELVHARARKENGRVSGRHQRVAWIHPVTLGPKKFKIRFSQLIRFHFYSSSDANCVSSAWRNNCEKTQK